MLSLKRRYRSCKRSGGSSTTTCRTPGNCRCCWVPMACLGLSCSAHRRILQRQSGACSQSVRPTDALPPISVPVLPMGYRPSLKPRRHTMLVEAQVTINGSQAAVWAAITNIENAANIISGIEHIEVLETPANGLVGLKWRETRMLFGNPASVEKWITDAAENEFYKTRAEDR